VGQRNHVSDGDPGPPTGSGTLRGTCTSARGDKMAVRHFAKLVTCSLIVVGPLLCKPS